MLHKGARGTEIALTGTNPRLSLSCLAVHGVTHTWIFIPVDDGPAPVHRWLVQRASHGLDVTWGRPRKRAFGRYLDLASNLWGTPIAQQLVATVAA
jgi:hypothetical protein